MAGPLLVVELPTVVAPEQASAMIAACTAGLRPGRCELSSEGADTKVSAIAVVSFQGDDRLRPLIEVGRRRDDREVWLSEGLTFRAADAPVEEFRSIGLTIAVLFHTLENPEAPGIRDKPTQTPTHALPPGDKSTADPARPPQPKAAPAIPNDEGSAPALSASHPVRGPGAWVASGPLIGWDPGTHAARYGVGASLGLVPVEPLIVGLSGRYRRAGVAGVDLRFATVGVGAGGAVLLPHHLWLRGRAEAVAEQVAASALDPGSQTTQTRSLWVSGLGGALDLVWTGGGWWGVGLTVVVERLAHGTTVQLYEQTVATTSPTGVEGVLSLELYPIRH